MNHLLAITKENKYRYLLSRDDEFYAIPKLDNTCPYDDEYKLKDGEWFLAENFSAQNYCLECLKNTFDSTAYDSLLLDSYPDLLFIMSVQGTIYTFQRAVKSTVLRKKMIALKLNNEPDLLDSNYTIVLNPEPDAIYDQGKDNLYFKNLSSITTIFPGINILYREATDEETNDFLNLQILNRAQDFKTEDVKTANRRRIKAAMDKLNSFNEEQKAELPNYIKKYCGEDIYDAETGKFVIDNEAQLTKLLNGINQRFYTTEIEGKKLLANSVTPI